MCSRFWFQISVHCTFLYIIVSNATRFDTNISQRVFFIFVHLPLDMKLARVPRLRPFNLPNPLLLLCLATLLHPLINPAGERPRGVSIRPTASVLVRAARDPDNLTDPVQDVFDYTNPDEPPEPADNNLDKLRPDDGNKPNANGGKGGGGKNNGNKDTNKQQNDNNGNNNNDNNDKNGMAKEKRNEQPNETRKKNDGNKSDVPLMMTDTADTATADTTMMMDTSTAGGETLPGANPAVVIDAGVALVPGAANASLVVSLPEVLPPMPVDSSLLPQVEDNSTSSSSAILPTSGTFPVESSPASAPVLTSGGMVGLPGALMMWSVLAAVISL